MIRTGIVTHGGVGAPREWSDGCQAAAEAGHRILDRGGHALDAVQAAAVVLEDDGRFNAGSGAILRLDGRTIETDASLMDSEGHLGIVAAVQGLKNPILAAREVMKTPHVILSGEGALAFARARGVAAPHPGPGSLTRDRYEKIKRLIGEKKFEEFRAAWRSFDIKSNWNFEVPYEEVFGHGDTVGAVALDQEGRLAAANSTGGASPMLAGRIGDSPIIGCGFYAGPAAAVATTGIGEEIIRRILAKGVYDSISQGEEVVRASTRGVEQYPQETAIGLIAISRRGWAVAHNREMATGSIIRED